MPRAPSTSSQARYDQGHSLTLTQVSICHQLREVSADLLNHLRNLRLAAGLPLSAPPPPDSSGILREMFYIGLGEEAHDNVENIFHPRFGDLGRIMYKKPVPKASPIIRWDTPYIPRALLESDAELLRLLTKRAKLDAKWVRKIMSIEVRKIMSIELCAVWVATRLHHRGQVATTPQHKWWVAASPQHKGWIETSSQRAGSYHTSA
ncbi:hypothetical protein BDP27DRAFT_1362794 [Rhodocollybia butyracea]|uniref:Uncharacterized protein n=1 Tax=Rhodocollybia butyracea TaxID=206335 RepID=A0A9P5U9P0_9AGAR|nr:hypothetical protein BDP27DRAFT_1362794 [Rhodocollybia butyracea]